MLVLADVSSKLEYYAGLKATKWVRVAETLQPYIDRNDQERPLQQQVCNIKAFSVVRILGNVLFRLEPQ